MAWRLKPALPVLFVIQFFSWSAMFCLWVYAVPVIAAAQPSGGSYSSAATTAASGFTLYAVLGTSLAFVGPRPVARLGAGVVHGMALLAAGCGIILFGLHPAGLALFAAFALIGVGWASMSSIPYALASAVAPPGRGARRMRLFAFSTVLPQVAVTLLLALVGHGLELQTSSIVTVAGGGAMLIAAFVALLFRHQLNVEIPDW